MVPRSHERCAQKGRRVHGEDRPCDRGAGRPSARGQQQSDETAKPVQTWLSADALAIQRLLQTNSNSIIAQNMLEKGNSRLEAKKEFDTLILILGLAKELTMSMEFQDRARMLLRLDANL